MANLNSKKRYHYTYKTTNKINDRYYLGMHSTNNLNDGYLGSGHRLRYEIKKYGKSNFSIEILNYYNSRSELIEAEKELISELKISDKNCLNLKGGGSGGFSTFWVKEGNKLAAESLRKKWKNEEWRKNQCKLISKGIKVAVADGRMANIQNHYSWEGKTRSEKTKEKISKTMKNKRMGKNNSQYGTMWIYNESLRKNKKIDKNSAIPEGWEMGRVMEYYK